MSSSRPLRSRGVHPSPQLQGLYKKHEDIDTCNLFEELLSHALLHWNKFKLKNKIGKHSANKHYFRNIQFCNTHHYVIYLKQNLRHEWSNSFFMQTYQGLRTTPRSVQSPLSSPPGPSHCTLRPGQGCTPPERGDRGTPPWYTISESLFQKGGDKMVYRTRYTVSVLSSLSWHLCFASDIHIPCVISTIYVTTSLETSFHVMLTPAEICSIFRPNSSSGLAKSKKNNAIYKIWQISTISYALWNKKIKMLYIRMIWSLFIRLKKKQFLNDFTIGLNDFKENKH